MKVEELRGNLSEKNLDSFVAYQNAHYLADTTAAVVVIVSEESATLLSSRLDFDRAKRDSKIKDVRSFSKSEVPLREGEEVLFESLGKVTAGILEELGAENVGFDELADGILKDLKENHEADYEKESDIIWDLRKVKTEEEIDRLRKAAEIASQGMNEAEKLIEAGRREIEIAAEIEYRMRKLGSGGVSFDTIVASGENSWFPHGGASEKKLAEGELVTIDLGAKWKNYNSDMSRTYAISPTPEQEKILDLTKKAQEVALEKVEAGRGMKEIDQEARRIFKEVGKEEYYLHGTGHGVGLDVHEPPSINPSSEGSLEKGMVITIEPGIYTKEHGGCRFEDMVLVKKDGYEKLTSN